LFLEARNIVSPRSPSKTRVYTIVYRVIVAGIFTLRTIQLHFSFFSITIVNEMLCCDLHDISLPLTFNIGSEGYHGLLWIRPLWRDP
jgi:hypothetical protein